MFNRLKKDFQIIFERDPAARNWLEVIFCYPGFQAIVLHRLAHSLYCLGLPFFPRLISHFSRFLTGIEIHPGAVIGQGIFIDHGMGVVIGETAIIGDYCLIYQGVTLGGTGKQSGKRHPTLGENVVVGSGAKVLGNLLIGDNVRIGAGSVVLKDVPANCTVVGVPGRIIYRSGVKVNPLEHGNLPDSEAEVIRTLLDRIEVLEQQFASLQTAKEITPATIRRETTGVNCSETAPDYISPNYIVALETAYQTETKPKTSCRLQDKVIQEFLDGAGI